MPLPLPSKTEAWELLRAAAPPAWVLDHTEAVRALACAMADQAHQRAISADIELVEVGAILHDIGRSMTQDPRHAYLGGQSLREAGHNEQLVRIVERHTGAGLSAEDAQALGLPATPLIPETLEERIVAHADNLHTGTKRLQLEDILAKYEAKGLDDAGARIAKLHTQLEQELGVALDAFGLD